MKKKNKKLTDSRGVINIKSSPNNTIINICQENGEVLFTTSSGKVMGGGTKKSTPYAAEKATEIILQKVQEFSAHYIKLIVKGFGPGRDTALKKIFGSELLEVQELIEKTRIPFGGCRPPKRPRK